MTKEVAKELLRAIPVCNPFLTQNPGLLAEIETGHLDCASLEKLKAFGESISIGHYCVALFGVTLAPENGPLFNACWDILQKELDRADAEDVETAMFLEGITWEVASFRSEVKRRLHQRKFNQGNILNPGIN